MKFNFCPYCGAGLGQYRRRSINTCDKCDNDVTRALEEEIEDLKNEVQEAYVRMGNYGGTD